jgi:hypothetical protein
MSWKLSLSVNVQAGVETVITGSSIDFDRWLPTTSAVTAARRVLSAAMPASKLAICASAWVRHTMSGATFLNLSMFVITSSPPSRSVLVF